MKEIGGYIEFERNTGSLYHENAIALNCGRAALEYLIKAKGIRKLYVPYFCCDSIAQPCRRCNVEYEYYHIDSGFYPIFDKLLGEDEWLYIVNYYGQISNQQIEKYKKAYGRIIVDYAQSYFQMPVDGVDTLYTCRKFFGVPDGAFLYTDKHLHDLEQDESFERIHYILGRYERSGSEFYEESVANNKLFATESLKSMSKLTTNLLRGIDYDVVKKCRTDNFAYLHEHLGWRNKIQLTIPDGAFMYPFYSENGMAVRKELQKKQVYIPTLWPDVFNVCNECSLEYDYAMNVLPLPVDQRYSINDMMYLVAQLLGIYDKRG